MQNVLRKNLQGANPQTELFFACEEKDASTPFTKRKGRSGKKRKRERETHNNKALLP